MPVRIRLQRHGKKGKPFYWIVAADSRAKRDGRYLEKIGIYNPNTNPATVELDVDQAVKWLENGAQPSDTARTLLSYRGAMLRHHLNGGVQKGAFSQEEADKRFADWLEAKQAKIQAKIDGLDKQQADDVLKRLEAEKAVNQKRIADLSAPAQEESTAEVGESAESENTDAAQNAPADEAAPVETEAPQEAEATAEDTPAEETKAEEAPAEKTTAEPSTSEEAAATEAESTQEADTPAEEAPAEEAETKEAPAEDSPAQEEESKK